MDNNIYDTLIDLRRGADSVNGHVRRIRSLIESYQRAGISRQARAEMVSSILDRVIDIQEVVGE